MRGSISFSLFLFFFFCFVLFCFVSFFYAFPLNKPAGPLWLYLTINIIVITNNSSTTNNEPQEENESGKKRIKKGRNNPKLWPWRPLLAIFSFILFFSSKKQFSLLNIKGGWCCSICPGVHVFGKVLRRRSPGFSWGLSVCVRPGRQSQSPP